MRILLLSLLAMFVGIQISAQTYKVHTGSMPSGVTKPATTDYLYLEGEPLIYNPDYGFTDASDAGRTRYRTAQHPDDTWWSTTTGYDGSRFAARGSDVSLPWHLLAWDISDGPLESGIYDAYVRVYVTPSSNPQSGVSVAVTLDDDTFDPVSPEDDPPHVQSSTQQNIFWIPAGSVQITELTQHVRLHIKTQYCAVRVDTVFLVKIGTVQASVDIEPVNVTAPAWQQNSGWFFTGQSATIGISSASSSAFSDIRYAVRSSTDEPYIWKNFVTPVSGSWRVELDAPGWYDITVRGFTTDVNSGETIKVTEVIYVAVLGDAVAESLREQSIFGMWSVHGDPALISLANARWNREMLSFRNVTEAEAYATPTPGEVSYELKDGLKYLGVFAFGMPMWLMDLPANVQMPSFGNPFYPALDWNDVSLAVAAYARSRSLPAVMEMYNEPFAAWHGTDAELVSYASAVRQGLQSVDPDYKLIGPCLYSIRTGDLEDLAQVGLLDYLDGVSMHAYVDGTPPEHTFLDRIEALNSWLASWGQQDKLVYFSEFGWTRGKGTWLPPVSVWKQACYTARSQALVWSQGIDSSLTFSLKYNTSNEGEAGFGMLDAEDRPMPAYVSFAQVARWFAGSVPMGHFQLTPDSHLVLGYRQNKLQMAVWDEADSKPMQLPFDLNKAMDMCGADVPISGTMEIGPAPLYLEADQPSGMVSLPLDTVVNVSSLRDVTGVSWPFVLDDVEASLKPGMYSAFYQSGSQWRVLPVNLQAPAHLSSVHIRPPAGGNPPVLTLTVASYQTSQAQQVTLRLEDQSAKTITLTVPANAKRQAAFTITDYVANLQNTTQVSMITSDGTTYSQTVTYMGTDYINFTDQTLVSYDSGQDQIGNAVSIEGGNGIALTGNTWKAMPFSYTVTPDTVLEFDLTSIRVEEFVCIGLDNDLDFDNAVRLFQLAGSQSHTAISTTYDDRYVTGSSTHYVIPVGQHFTGGVSYLALVMDDDADANGSAIFRNVMIKEATDAVGINFNSYSVSSYASGQDLSGSASIVSDGTGLTLQGNIWKKIPLNYELTSKSMLEFTITGSDVGEIIAIGMDEDNVHGNGTRMFQLAGSQTNAAQFIHQHDSYSQNSTQHLVIPIGAYYTGMMANLAFVADDDINASSNVTFRNVVLYEGR